MIVLKCNDCEHKDVCKFADDMTKIKAMILNENTDLDNESVARFTIDCENYKDKCINGLNRTDSPLSPYQPPSAVPLPYKPLEIYCDNNKMPCINPYMAL